MINELTKSIKSHLYDRTTSPLFGAFVFSWVIWNYKLLMLIFSGKDVEHKYRIIETILYASKLDYSLYWFIYPSVTASIFIFVYPYPAKFVFHFWRNRQQELKTIRQAIDDETLLSVEESREIKRELYALEESNENQLKKKNIEIENLYKSLSEANGVNMTNQETMKELREQLNDFQKAKTKKDLDDRVLFLKALSDNEGKMNESQLINKLDWPKVKYDYIFEELANGKQIGRGGTAPNNFITLEHEGKRHLSSQGFL